MFSLYDWQNIQIKKHKIQYILNEKYFWKLMKLVSENIDKHTLEIANNICL